ncbi:MAG TPA: GNAT family N-acetyltransferase [Anaerolineae bacterium]|nr:GNAT family N-acetyltransferase [Anaerolineae bacterium]
MSVRFRPYEAADFSLVSDFLNQHYQPGSRDGNWLQPAWEYMHTHPTLDESALDRIRIWEEAGEIVAVAHYEGRLGEAFFQVHPGYNHLKAEMLDHAEANLCGETEEGERYLRAFINDFDPAFEAIAEARGYAVVERFARPLSEFPIPNPFPEIELPEGFRLKSLADENDLRKIHRVLWRGFNHPGEPPEDELEDRRKMQSGPNFRKDLTIVVEAPTGDFVSFCGMWYVGANKLAYVEPVATDPDYRRMGLGKAAVLEGIRRCGEEGAVVAYVGSYQEFYLTMGFRKLFDCRCWEKRF